MGILDKLLGLGGGDPPELRREIERAKNGLAAATAVLDAVGDAFVEVGAGTK